MSLSPDLQRELAEAFFLCDYKKNGKISSKEVGVVVRSIGLNPTEAELAEMVKEVDHKGGSIDCPSLGAMIAPRVKTQMTDKKELTDAFQVFDRNGDGLVSVHDMKISLTTLGEKLQNEELDELIREVDKNAEGQLSYVTICDHLLSK